MGPQFSLPGLICNSVIVSSFIVVVRCFCVVDSLEIDFVCSSSIS